MPFERKTGPGCKRVIGGTTMTAYQKASTTMFWFKQLTTSTFTKFKHQVNRVAFLRRNKKLILLLVVAWGVFVIGGYYLFERVGAQERNTFLIDQVASSEQLAAQCAPLLLEDDLLELTREVVDFAKGDNILFAAVLNHESKVVAHTDAEQYNKPYQRIQGAQIVSSIGTVAVEKGVLADGTRAITFHKPITFSDVIIGGAVFGMPEKLLARINTRFARYELLVCLFTTLTLLAVAFSVDRSKRRITQKGAVGVADGSQIGPYRLREKIAQGGMAELFNADYVRQDGFRRQVAVKKVLPHLAENDDFIKMFIREARLAALLQHPNIVQIFDFGQIQDTYLIAMEYIKGHDLGQILAKLKAPLPMDMAVFIVMKISLGLDYSHKRKDDETDQPLGIVHRDISPQNILISYQGEVKISDFGISKATTEPSLTQAGVIKGKLGYMSPEQALGRQVDHQTDIYSLGLVFYEILTGKRLYQFDSDIEAIRTIPEMVIPPLRSVRPDLPEELERIVMKCLEKDKRQRCKDAISLHDDLMQLKIKLQMTYDASDLSNFMRRKLNTA